MAAKKPSPILNALHEIRDEVKKTNERLDQTNERLDQTNERLDQTNERLDRQVDRLDSRIDGLDSRIDGLRDDLREGHLRLATEVISVADAVREVRDLLRDRLDDRHRIDDHELRLRRLEKKVG